MFIETKQKWPIITIAEWYVDVTKLQMFKGINCLSFKLPYKQWFQHKQMNSDIFVSLVNRNNRSHCSNQFNRGISRNLKKSANLIYLLFMSFFTSSLPRKSINLYFLTLSPTLMSPTVNPSCVIRQKFWYTRVPKSLLWWKRHHFWKKMKLTRALNISYTLFILP